VKIKAFLILVILGLGGLVEMEADDDPGAFKLWAARNEFEGFNCRVSGPVLLTGMEIDAPKGPGGMLPPAQISVCRLGGDLPGQGPTGAFIPEIDPFYGQRRRAFPCRIPAGFAAEFRIDIFIPPGTSPGTYRGAIRFLNAESRKLRFHYRLTIWDFDLEPGPGFRVELGLDGPEIAERHFLRARARYGEELELARLYLDRALLNRMCLPGILTADRLLCRRPRDWEGFERTWSRYLVGRDLPGGPARVRVERLWIPDSPPRARAAGNEPGSVFFPLDSTWGSVLASELNPEWPLFLGSPPPVWGKGGCFIPGRPEEIGGTRHIPLDTPNARAWRDRIEREQYHRMVLVSGGRTILELVKSAPGACPGLCSRNLAGAFLQATKRP